VFCLKKKIVGLMIITLRFAPARFPQLWVKEA
ncbi:hypothetical protein, partial [Escherichia coli]